MCLNYCSFLYPHYRLIVHIHIYAIVLCVNSVASVLLSVHPSSSIQEDEDSQSSFIMKNAKQGQAALGPGFTLKF